MFESGWWTEKTELLGPGAYVRWYNEIYSWYVSDYSSDDAITQHRLVQSVSWAQTLLQQWPLLRLPITQVSY